MQMHINNAREGKCKIKLTTWPLAENPVVIYYKATWPLANSQN